MPTPLDSRVSSEARQWVDSLDAKWRLQILSKRYRQNSKGERVELPTRIRRFVEGIPHALVDDAIKYLLSKAPYKGVIYNGVEIEGEYRPTLTQWSRDNQDSIHTAGSSKNDGTYTLVQDLIEKSLWDTYSVGSGLSCSEEVQSDYVWDSPSIDELPETGSLQGVSWSIQSISRNEDGTFNYAIVKRVAKTQHLPKSLVKSTSIDDVEIEGWKSVYGSADAGWRDEAGTPLDIPAASSGGGRMVELQYSLTQDCTYDISATTTTSKPRKISRETHKTLFTHDSKDGLYGQRAPIDDAPKASGGVVRTHEYRLQPDGSYTTTEGVTREQAVKSQTIRVVSGPRGVLRTVTNVNQTSAPSTSGLSVGESVEITRTPGDLYNVTRTEWECVPRVAGASCKKTIYQHDHSTTSSGKSLFSGHVEDASGGRVRTVSSTLADDGIVTTTESVDTELPVSSSQRTVSVTPFGKTVTVVDRNQKSPASEQGLSVGDSVSVEKTPGGLYNNTRTSFTRTILRSGVSCRQDLFSHEHSTTDTVSRLPVDHVPPALGGVTHNRNATLRPDGSYVQEDTETRELKVERYRYSQSRTARALRTTEDHRNMPAANLPVPSIGGTVSYQRTPGGLYDVSITTSTPSAIGRDSTCSRTMFRHDHSTTTYSDEPGPREAPSAGGGHTYQKSVHIGEDGVYAVTDASSDELPQESQFSYEDTYFEKTDTECGVNKAGKLAHSGFKEGSLESCDSQLTPGGRWNTTKTTRTPKARDWVVEVDTHWRYSYRFTFMNYKWSDYNSKWNELKNNFTSKLESWSRNGSFIADHRPSSYSITPSVQYNQFGLVDGSISFDASWSMGSCGKDLPSDSTSIASWTTESRSINLTAESMSEGEGKTRMVYYRCINTTTQSHEVVAGRGADKFSSAFSGRSNLTNGTSASFNPSDSTWSFHAVTNGTQTATKHEIKASESEEG